MPFASPWLELKIDAFVPKDLVHVRSGELVILGVVEPANVQRAADGDASDVVVATAANESIGQIRAAQSAVDSGRDRFVGRHRFHPKQSILKCKWQTSLFE